MKSKLSIISILLILFSAHSFAENRFPKDLIGIWEMKLQREGSEGIQRWTISTDGKLSIQEEGNHIFMRMWVPEIKEGNYRFRSLDGESHVHGTEGSFRIKTEKEKDTVVVERIDTLEVVHKWSIENQTVSPEIKYILNQKKDQLSFLTESGEVAVSMQKVESVERGND